MTSIDVPGILQGYAQGLFLMSDEETGDLGWYSTRQRTLIPLDNRFHCPRSLKTALNQQRFQPAIDRAFAQVMEGCADRPVTWISSELKAIYWALYKEGWAHSFETWQGDTLAGGILGIAIGGVFIGESMFFAIPNGSKVAMVLLVQHLRARRFQLFDAQLPNPHLARFGSIDVSQVEYMDLLRTALQQPCQFT